MAIPTLPTFTAGQILTSSVMNDVSTLGNYQGLFWIKSQTIGTAVSSVTAALIAAEPLPPTSVPPVWVVRVSSVNAMRSPPLGGGKIGSLETAPQGGFSRGSRVLLPRRRP